jgi:hypothetical protein
MTDEKPKLRSIEGGKYRPPAPAELTPEQAATWRETVERMPSGWFPSETFPLLAQFCRHISEANFIAKRLAAMRADNEEEGGPSIQCYGPLLALQDRETSAIARIATKLRLTPQSRFTPTRAETTLRREGGVASGEPEDDYFTGGAS